MSGRNGTRSTLLVVAGVLMLAACGDGDDVGPEPTLAPEATAVAVGSAGVRPFVEPKCPDPRTPAERNAPRVTKAAENIRVLGRKRFPAEFAGVVPCLTERRLVVYRVPRTAKAAAGEAGLVATIRQVGRNQQVKIGWAIASFTHKQAKATQEKVLQRFAELEAAGAPFAVLSIQENGTVEVGVRANVPAAEQVLSDLLDRIYVVLVPETETQPETVEP